MKKGFTLLELLVASLLLSMLLTILTQLFTQSSIAWRTGEAGVTELDQMRKEISAIQRDADNAIKVNGALHSLCSVWNKNGGLSTRGYDDTWESGKQSLFNNPSSWVKIPVTKESNGSNGRKNYLIGVTSAGPDGKFDTWDDITSWSDGSDD